MDPIFTLEEILLLIGDQLLVTPVYGLRDLYHFAIGNKYIYSILGKLIEPSEIAIWVGRDYNDDSSFRYCDCVASTLTNYFDFNGNREWKYDPSPYPNRNKHRIALRVNPFVVAAIKFGCNNRHHRVHPSRSTDHTILKIPRGVWHHDALILEKVFNDEDIRIDHYYYVVKEITKIHQASLESPEDPGKYLVQIGSWLRSSKLELIPVTFGQVEKKTLRRQLEKYYRTYIWPG